MDILNITVFCAGIVLAIVGFIGISKNVDWMFDEIRGIYDNINNGEDDADLEEEKRNNMILFALHVTLIILFFAIFVLGVWAWIHAISGM